MSIDPRINLSFALSGRVALMVVLNSALRDTRCAVTMYGARAVLFETLSCWDTVHGSPSHTMRSRSPLWGTQVSVSGNGAGHFLTWLPFLEPAVCLGLVLSASIGLHVRVHVRVRVRVCAHVCVCVCVCA